MPHTHALFLGQEFQGEVTPDTLNHYSPERLVALPSTYWTRGYYWSWSGRSPVEDLRRADADLLARIKAEAELRKMGFLSPGGAKKSEYAGKQAEVQFFDSLGGTVTVVLGIVMGWTADRRASVFPHATASVRRRGGTLADAIGRFRAGIAAATTYHDICAEEEKVCDAIRAATTATAKRAAAAAASWPA